MSNKTKWKQLYELGEPLMVLTTKWQPVTKCPSKYKQSATFMPVDNSPDNLVAIYHKLGNSVTVRQYADPKYNPATFLEPSHKHHKFNHRGDRIYENLNKRILGIDQDVNSLNYGD